MAKLELKGKVMFVGGVETVGKNDLKKQQIIVTVPPYRDEFGDILGREENWQFSILGKKVEEFDFDDDMLLKKIHCKGFVNSNTVINEDGDEMYIIEAVLYSFEIIP